MTTPLVDDGLWHEVDGRLRLVGSRCGGCGAVTFPRQQSCPACAGVATEAYPLAATGVLWTYTIQRFPPKRPYRGADAPFIPFGVGYVDLGDVIVETRIVGDLDSLEIGMTMVLTTEEVHGVTGFAFEPAATGAVEGRGR